MVAAVTIAVRFELVELGVDGEAFLLPTWIAAPSGGTYGFVGLRV